MLPVSGSQARRTEPSSQRVAPVKPSGWGGGLPQQWEVGGYVIPRSGGLRFLGEPPEERPTTPPPQSGLYQPRGPFAGPGREVPQPVPQEGGEPFGGCMHSWSPSSWAGVRFSVSIGL